MAWTGRYDSSEPSRINRWLAHSGVCSRREAEGLIARGLVSIDGVRVDDPGRKIEAGQTLVVADDAEAGQGAFTAVLNKPVGIVSAQPEQGQVPAIRLLTAEALVGTSATMPGRDTSLAPLGRLDMDSHGLLLLSSDGVLAKAIIGPESELEKEYLVRVFGTVTDRKLAQLRFGLRLDGRQLKPAKIGLVGEGRLRFVLKEGRKRQIRRMCDLVQLKVADLERIRIGPLALGDLPGRALAGVAAGRAAGADQGVDLGVKPGATSCFPDDGRGPASCIATVSPYDLGPGLRRGRGWG